MLNQPNILVCTDFSASSTLAVKAAKRIAQKTNGKVSILNVIDHPTLDNWKAYESLSYSVGEALNKELLAHATLSLKQQLRECETEAISEVKFGSPKTVIMDQATKNKVDLLIIGYSGKTEGHNQMGNLTTKILAESAVPVLVMKSPFEIKKIAGLIDPNGSKKEILSWSEELTYFFSPEMIVISLFADHLARFIGENKNNEKIFQDLKDLSAEVKKDTVHRIDKEIHEYLNKYPDAKIIIRNNIETNVAQHLNSLLTEEGIDTVIMRKHKSSLFERVFIGTETRRMLDLFNGNIFVLP